MNFLGHFYLSKNDTGLILGNYIADFVKGKNYNNYPEHISRGIMMHRRIDTFTDSHAMVRRGRKRIFEKYRHFAGIVIDMYYDHFLAQRWLDFSDMSLPEYSAFVYSIIEENLHLLPPPSQYMFTYMKNGNWLMRYATTEGLEKSLRGMAGRISHPSRLEEATEDLIAFYPEWDSEFLSFMSDLQVEFGV